MTRARYFFLVPWTYQRLEDKGVSSTEIARSARHVPFRNARQGPLDYGS